MIRRIPILILVFLLLLTLLPKKRSPSVPANVLRLHILANSDSPEDQAVKLRVRDALLPLFEAAATYDDARAFVLDHGDALLSLAQSTLAAAGMPYGAQLLLGVASFPDRVYDGVFFPAGPYDALQIILGDGAGHNWWCVLFPPLCIVTRDGVHPCDPVPDDSVAAEEGLTGGVVTFESDLLALLRKWFRQK